MDIADITTSPLPAHAREPLLLVIDAYEERCMLLIRLLAFANYRTYAATTSHEDVVAGSQVLSLMTTIAFRDTIVAPVTFTIAGSRTARCSHHIHLWQQLLHIEFGRLILEAGDFGIHP